MMRAVAFAAVGILAANAQVTIYTTFATATDGTIVAPTGVPAAVALLNAYNTTTLPAPALPTPMPQLQMTALIPSDPSGVATGNLSAPIMGNMVGFSVELSVANQVLGTNSSRLAVPFLNYIANLKTRSGASPNIRVGGNTQETYLLYEDGFPNGQIIRKTAHPGSTTTDTPDVDISADLLYAMTNITALLGTQWYFGLPFANTNNDTGIATVVAYVEKVLGSSLLALQLGNEPDLYGLGNRKRQGPYFISNYTSEIQAVVAAMQAEPAIANQQILLGPSVCCNVLTTADPPVPWDIQDVIGSGYMDTFASSLKMLAVQHYPYDNCAGDVHKKADDIIWDYFRHGMATRLVTPYLVASATAAAAGKPFVMFETNTASCGGHVGISDTFGAALWTLDYSLQMAYRNFTNALYHFGGQNVAYNPFTPPPGTIASSYQWTTGPMYYAMLAIAEAFGPSNNSRITDLMLNFDNDYTPGYAIYEGNVPTKAVFINWMDSSLGPADYTVNITFTGVNGAPAAALPSSVSVRRLSAATINQKFNITWAGQNMGGPLESDGRLHGDVDTETVLCTPAGCPITVKAPSAVLVFLTPDALNAVSPANAATATFATTVETGRYAGGATVDQAVLATSNGRGGNGTKDGGSTSSGKAESGAGLTRSVSLFLGMGLSVGLGALLCLGRGAFTG